MYIRNINEEESLWADFIEGDKKNPDKLAEYYSSFSLMLAKKQFQSLRFEEHAFDDFLQNANIGLLDAIRRYNPDAGADFHTYAAYRIKGAILNGLSVISEKSQYYSYIRRYQSDRKKSMVESVNKEETITIDSVGQLVVELAYSYLLDELSGDEECENISESDTPYLSYKLQQYKKTIIKYIRRLPEREENILRWHYFEYLTFKEISVLMNITKGRVSQIHHRALQRLREFCSDISDFTS